jgi:hypothetical protein
MSYWFAEPHTLVLYRSQIGLSPASGIWVAATMPSRIQSDLEAVLAGAQIDLRNPR